MTVFAEKDSNLGTVAPHTILPIDSFAELIERQEEILRRIEAVPNGGNLFLIHPLLLLADVGVALSDRARTELLDAKPHLRALSETPYRALKASRSPQRYRVHVRALGRRTTP